MHKLSSSSAHFLDFMSLSVQETGPMTVALPLDIGSVWSPTKLFYFSKLGKNYSESEQYPTEVQSHSLALLDLSKLKRGLYSALRG
jgi:hypothetical protein